MTHELGLDSDPGRAIGALDGDRRVERRRIPEFPRIAARRRARLGCEARCSTEADHLRGTRPSACSFVRPDTSASGSPQSSTARRSLALSCSCRQRMRRASVPSRTSGQSDTSRLTDLPTAAEARVSQTR